MIIHKMTQGEPDWFAVRKGKMTASKATAIGNAGKGLDTYITELMAEYYSSGEKEHFSNSHTDRGNELEEQARNLYELESGYAVEQVGFVELNEFVGCSPDGLIGEDGGWECKCPDDKSYFKLLLNGESEIDSGYIWQVQMNLKITGRQWWDLTFYNPNYDNPMFIKRIFPDATIHAKLEIGFMTGEEKIKQIKNKMYAK